MSPMKGAWLISGAIVVLAIMSYWLAPSDQVAANRGEFIAAVTSAIAVVWLIAGIRQQSEEIRLQRVAIANQQQELALQRTEIERLGRYSALGQVNALLEQFSRTLREWEIPNCKSVEDLPKALVAGMPELGVVLNQASSASDVIAAYGRWGRIESACLQFLACLRLSYSLYHDAGGGSPAGSPEDDIAHFADQSALLDGIPFLHRFRATAGLVAQTLKAGDAHRLLAQIRSLEALEKQLPGAVRREALDELQARLERLRHRAEGAPPAGQRLDSD